MAYHLYLGMIGDDFTGSSDAASFAAMAGLKTMLFDGIPQDIDLEKEWRSSCNHCLKEPHGTCKRGSRLFFSCCKMA